jgi:hypothetical protein
VGFNRTLGPHPRPADNQESSAIVPALMNSRVPAINSKNRSAGREAKSDNSRQTSKRGLKMFSRVYDLMTANRALKR